MQLANRVHPVIRPIVRFSHSREEQTEQLHASSIIQPVVCSRRCMPPLLMCFD